MPATAGFCATRRHFSEISSHFGKNKAVPGRFVRRLSWTGSLLTAIQTTHTATSIISIRYVHFYNNCVLSNPKQRCRKAHYVFGFPGGDPIYSLSANWSV